MPLDFNEVAEALSDLTALNYFPRDDEGRLAVVKIVGRMAATMEQVYWLVDRMVALYNDWPGPAELRAVFCKKFSPADGIDTRNIHTSSFFPDGNIPCETPEAPSFAAGCPQLLAGHKLTALPEVENAIRQASAQMAIAERRRRPAPSVPVNRNFRRLTADDLAGAVKGLREARTAGHAFELGAGGLCVHCWLPADDVLHVGEYPPDGTD